MALAKTCLEAGATVAVTDVLPQAAPAFLEWRKNTPERLLYYRQVIRFVARLRMSQIADLQSCDLTKKEEVERTFANILEKLHHIHGV